MLWCALKISWSIRLRAHDVHRFHCDRAYFCMFSFYLGMCIVYTLYIYFLLKKHNLLQSHLLSERMMISDNFYHDILLMFFYVYRFKWIWKHWMCFSLFTPTLFLVTCVHIYLINIHKQTRARAHAHTDLNNTIPEPNIIFGPYSMKNEIRFVMLEKSHNQTFVCLQPSELMTMC